jgi:hypothetical protein
MIEGILFALELTAMLLVLVAVVREGRPGNNSRLGLFDFVDETATEPPRQKGRSGA